MAQKTEAIDGLTGGIEGLFKKNKVDYYKGWGKFGSSASVNVDLNDGGSETLNAKNIIIATGSEPNSLPEASGLATDEKFVVSSTGALELPSIPKKMVVLGGGVIGLEMGSVYARLGTEVTVIQHGPMICPFLDNEISKKFLQTLKKQGIKFLLDHGVTDGVNNKENGVKVNVKNEKTGEVITLDTDILLVSIGRHAFTGGLDLDKAGLETNNRGQVEIDTHTW